LALWLVVPVAFFSLVPADTRFFARYVLPVAPFLLLLVVVGCLEVGRLVRRPLPAAILLVAALTGWQALEVTDRLRDLRGLRLSSAVHQIDQLERAVIFSSTGAPVRGRPAELMDDYVVLELAGVGRVEELPAIDPRYEPDVVHLGVREVQRFLADGGPPGQGAWLLAGPAGRVLLGERRLRAAPGIVAVRLSPELLLAHSAGSVEREDLVEQAIAVRELWLGLGRDRWARAVLTVDRRALGTQP
jgi:hypothetical protein